jgi:hypothetical protein
MKVNKKTYEKLLDEAQKLVEQGYDEKIIAEQLFDFLGKAGGSAITQTLKGQIIKFVLDKLGIVDSKSFLGLAIINFFSNVEIKDYARLGECNFVSSQLTKAILETFIDKLRISAGMDSILFVGIKEFMTEAGSNTEAFKKLQGYVSSFICPIVSEIADTFDFSAFSGK